MQIEKLIGRPVGRVLEKMEIITREQLVNALQVQKRIGGPVGEILVSMGYINREQLMTALNAQHGIASGGDRT